MDASSDIIITVWADLEQSPLGPPSRLAEDLAGMPVLRRTTQRISQVQQVAARVIYCRQQQREAVADLVDGLPVDVVGLDFDRPQRWPSIQATRKWAKTCWRGGLMGGCGFDEDLVPEVVYQIAKRYGASAVLSVPAAAAVVDPAILDQQIKQYVTHLGEYKIGFTQAPPGLSGVIVETELLDQLARSGQLAGSALVYHPDAPKSDIISGSCNLTLDRSIIHTSARLLGDSSRALATLGRLLSDVPAERSTATAVAEWVTEHATAFTCRWPDEIQIELVGGWPVPKGYRPSPPDRRGPIDADRVIERLADLAGECDDLLVCLGGFGEPTGHPQFATIVERLADAGVWGICVNTMGLFDQRTAETIAGLPIDVVTVLIDVPDQALYEQVMGVDAYEQAAGTVERLIRLRQEAHRPLPLVVPEMIKTFDTMPLMDGFYDPHLRRAGSAVIRGYSDYARQRDDLAVSSMAPPDRRACRQLWSRMTVLADGSVAACDQDFLGKRIIGSIANDSLINLWQGGQVAELRDAHLAGRYDSDTLCAACDQWHRP